MQVGRPFGRRCSSWLTQCVPVRSDDENEAATVKRKGTYRPTLEDAAEISGIETLHPGGFALTERTAQVAGIGPGMKVLDVSSGRGTQAIHYAQEFGAEVTGVDISVEMTRAATALAAQAGLGATVHFELGDSQALPFDDATFDVVINECAVGIPEDSQRVLDEMVRVVRPGGSIAIHESTWRQPLRAAEKEEIAERYGTTPLERDEWTSMLRQAGATDIRSELEPWSEPENFWQVRKDRQVAGPNDILTTAERLRTVWRLLRRYGPRGVFTALRNERKFYRAIVAGQLGYGLYWGVRPEAVPSGR